MPSAESAHKAKAKMDVLALINQNYLLTRAGLWEHHSCNGYINKRLKGLASLKLTDCGHFIMSNKGAIATQFNDFIYNYYDVSVHMLYVKCTCAICWFFSRKKSQ